MPRLPDLSRFEMQCLRRLWARREASVREIYRDLNESPSYSTVRKIFERLEEKGAIARVRMEGRAWVYRPAIPVASMIRKEIRSFLDNLFDGSAGPLVAHLAEMNEVSLEDLAALEKRLRGAGQKPAARRRTRRRERGQR